MKQLLKNKWVLLIIAVVILYFVWQKYGKKKTEEVTVTPGNGNGDAVAPPMPTERTVGVDEAFAQHADNY